MVDVHSYLGYFDGTRESSNRGAPYPVQAPSAPRGQAQWPRNDAALKQPTAFTSDLKSTTFAGEPYDVQIRTVITNYHRYIGASTSRESLKTRVSVITSFYKELKARGYDIRDVTTFSLRHAKALLEIWRARNVAPNTLYVRWSLLRTWSRTLGKGGMIGPLTDYIQGFERKNDAGEGYRTFTKEEIATRSAYLRSKADLTPYLVDRITRELKVTRETAFQFDIDALQGVVEGGMPALRVGYGTLQISIPHIQNHVVLMTEVRDFMLARSRKTLAWSGFDVDAAIQKYARRMTYVNSTLFPKNQADAPGHNMEGIA